MVTRKCKRYGSQFKFGVALEAIKGQKTINEIASETGVHPNQVRDWKKKLMDEGVTVFGQNLAVQLQEQENRETELYEQIGRLKMELELLKKKLPHTADERRKMIELDHSFLSIRRQCELIGLNRATYYWQPANQRNCT
jgi:putative transposase